ncbi:hypothetical protein KUTeg_020564 [Tegillarca granosa]|uniref:Histone deacetylase domain-containing protein n=1 Tax=Tegillarca granosa TaxID=220873 RepID=A0ABQ9ECH6_TEGGR|nr:hypothetical protein KUTeg_020564 [Tegillarca granosa]
MQVTGKGRSIINFGYFNDNLVKTLPPSKDKEEHKTQLYLEVKKTQWPIIYSAEYNIGFLGLEKLHPFDAGKWGRVYAFLKEAGMIRDDTIVTPLEASEDDLRFVHSKEYINSLKLTSILEGIDEWSLTVAGITEVPPVALLPNFIVQRKVLRPFRYQTGGTILAGKLAVERGWAINIGGGFHHCSADRGGGFCAYADITLSIKFLFNKGNGHERDFMDDSRVYILDVYNRGIYPHDGYAKSKYNIQHTEGALNEFTPDVIVYNAGTDILEGDPLGNLNGIIERDQIVFEKARSRKIPVFMVTSGGYQKTTARIIADSILNLKERKLIECEEAENAPLPKSANIILCIHDIIDLFFILIFFFGKRKLEGRISEHARSWYVLCPEKQENVHKIRFLIVYNRINFIAFTKYF